MEVVVIENKLWQELNQRLESMEKHLHSITAEKKEHKPKPDVNFNWIPLKEALSLMQVSRSFWDRELKTQLKFRQYGKHYWVYRPSIDKWFLDHSIN